MQDTRPRCVIRGLLRRIRRGHRLELDLVDGDRSVLRQRFDFALVTLLGICRWIVGNNLRPLVAEFAHPAPVAVKPYEAAFRCPLRFGAPKYRPLFAAADLAWPLPTSNPVLAELHERYAGENLDRLDNAKARAFFPAPASGAMSEQTTSAVRGWRRAGYGRGAGSRLATAVYCGVSVSAAR
jgi:hypothetical protein